jgi:uncharacterized cupin superfamily protein
MANLHHPEFDGGQEREGFTYRRAKLGAQAGAERLGASLYELPPGQAAFPFHFHTANEELIVILRGRPHLRTGEGWRQLGEGDVVSCPVGERGAHQIHNRTDAPVRMLVVSEMNAPDLVFQPDSDKFVAGERPPGGAKDSGRLFATFRLDDEVDYWEGEEPPAAE